MSEQSVIDNSIDECANVIVRACLRQRKTFPASIEKIFEYIHSNVLLLILWEKNFLSELLLLY